MSDPDLKQALNAIVDHSIPICEKEYAFGRDAASRLKRDWAIQALNDCRDKSVDELRDLLMSCQKNTADNKGKTNFFFYRAYESEVKWICRCFSVVLLKHNISVLMRPSESAIAEMGKLFPEGTP